MVAAAALRRNAGHSRGGPREPLSVNHFSVNHFIPRFLKPAAGASTRSQCSAFADRFHLSRRLPKCKDGDVWVMSGDRITAPPELFVADKLHPSADGYTIRTMLMRPVIDPK